MNEFQFHLKIRKKYGFCCCCLVDFFQCLNWIIYISICSHCLLFFHCEPLRIACFQLELLCDISSWIYQANCPEDITWSTTVQCWPKHSLVCKLWHLIGGKNDKKELHISKEIWTFLCVLKILLRLFPDVKYHPMLNILVVQDFEHSLPQPANCLTHQMSATLCSASAEQGHGRAPELPSQKLIPQPRAQKELLIAAWLKTN